MNEKDIKLLWGRFGNKCAICPSLKIGSCLARRWAGSKEGLKKSRN